MVVNGSMRIGKRRNNTGKGRSPPGSSFINRMWKHTNVFLWGRYVIMKTFVLWQQEALKKQFFEIIRVRRKKTVLLKKTGKNGTSMALTDRSRPTNGQG